MLIDYQDHVFDILFEQDPRQIKLNVLALAQAAMDFKIPVIVSTVGVEMGVNRPTIDSLRAVLPNVRDIDRSTTERVGRKQVPGGRGGDRTQAAGDERNRHVRVSFICRHRGHGDGYEVAFVEDAVGDTYKECHDAAVRRLVQAGAIPRTTSSMIAEWFRDWKSPLADAARKLYVPYFDDLAVLKQSPLASGPRGLVATHTS